MAKRRRGYVCRASTIKRICRKYGSKSSKCKSLRNKCKR